MRILRCVASIQQLVFVNIEFSQIHDRERTFSRLQVSHIPASSGDLPACVVLLPLQLDAAPKRFIKDARLKREDSSAVDFRAVLGALAIFNRTDCMWVTSCIGRS